MSIEQDPRGDADVLPFERPPIRTSVVVQRGRDAVFDTFVRTIDRWWPLRPFSMGQDAVASVTFERELGGRVYETWHDGTEREWGILLDWAPPERFVMTWNVTGVPTEVELRFTAEASDRTRVDLEHRGWDRLSEEQLREDCALPGGYRGGSFQRGWRIILQDFVDAVNGEAVGAAPASVGTRGKA
ncbi:MAG: SRPBCC domain-containing protein [Humibacter sp.]